MAILARRIGTGFEKNGTLTSLNLDLVHHLRCYRAGNEHFLCLALLQNPPATTYAARISFALLKSTYRKSATSFALLASFALLQFCCSAAAAAAAAAVLHLYVLDRRRVSSVACVRPVLRNYIGAIVIVIGHRWLSFAAAIPHPQVSRVDWRRRRRDGIRIRDIGHPPSRCWSRLLRPAHFAGPATEY